MNTAIPTVTPLTLDSGAILSSITRSPEGSLRTVHGFCTLHQIAYNRTLDAHCPQCILGHVQGVEQLDYAEVPVQTQVTRGMPVNAAGKPVDPLSGKAL